MLAFMVVSALIALVVFSILSPMAFFATTNTINAISENLDVPATCVPVISNTLITFPSTQPGSYASTSNDVNVIDQGSAAGNILVDGGNWISGSYSFWVTNTLWSPTSGANIGSQLVNTITGVDTKIPVKANGGNDLYFGVNIPTGQTAASYAETINVLFSC